MSSGIEWDETGVAAGNTDNSLARMYNLPLGDWTGYVLSQPMAYDPGAVYVYNTGASIMLADIVQRASGMLFVNFVHDFMQEPMEMTRLPGVGFTTGATILPRDLARLGQVYLRRGLWKDTRIVSESYVDDSFVERQVPGPGLGYGYQWWMRTLKTDQASYRVRYASGNGGQFIIVVDELDAVIVFTGGSWGMIRMNQVFPLVESHVLPMLE
jgi:CubicO group peptidase (beta-lactamase class C family)